MAKALVVVESPAKAKTINKYLGRNYKVIASMGHVRDLPKSKLGVEIGEDFEPSYEVIASRKKVLKDLKDAAKESDEIFIATDPDREGEAIGWHLAEELGAGNRKKIRRLMFNEITKKGILAALEKPTKINKQMVDAQQARRVLDRLVGYKISPILWDKVRRGLSAGRVQSVALKLVADREREIDAFVPEEYWNITARLAASVPPEFDAKLQKRDGSNIKVTSQAEADAVLADLKQADWIVASVTTKERKKNAVPPFITSKLQQAARFPVKKTMMIAQQLYEGIELPGEGAVGLITYMRTDSTRVSEQAITEVREHIAVKYGPDFVPEKANIYKTKADAQDAHEAIRPTSMQYDPESVRAQLTPDQLYLYRLIWNRFVASQMPPATFDETTVDINASNYTFRVKGSVPKFAGWMAVYNQETIEAKTEGPGPDAVSADDEDGSGILPAMQEGETLQLRELKPEQKFTQPPPRYSEATLVKALEENGIGRPSTYASIISVIQARDYVNKIEGRFKPTMLGRVLVEPRVTPKGPVGLLSPTFDDILDVNYTRELEEDLDKIEEGTSDYKKTLGSFYKKFEKDLKKASKEMINLKEGVEPDPPVTCDKCGKPMVIKAGKFGLFLACSGYPDCENTRELETPRARRRRRSRRKLRELRPADGDEARTVRSIPRLHRISRVQDHEEDHHHQAGHDRREARSDSRREVPEVRVEPRAQAGTLRRVHGVQQLSGVQVRQAEVNRTGLPQGRWRRCRAQVEARKSILRVRELSGLRLRAVEQAGARAVSSVRREVPDREDHEAARTSAPVS
jgi:DNA topoisomerase-1